MFDVWLIWPLCNTVVVETISRDCFGEVSQHRARIGIKSNVPGLYWKSVVGKNRGPSFCGFFLLILTFP